MVKTQIEFNKKYSKKEEVKEIEIRTEDFEEQQLDIEDYPNLEKLYLHDVQEIEKITLRSLTKLQECTIWDCGVQELVIENCPKIRTLNVCKNLLTSLEFVKNLGELQKLEIDRNKEIDSGLEHLPTSLQEFTYKNRENLQKLVSSDKDLTKEKLQELLRLQGENKRLKDDLEFSQQKYNDLKEFLSEILVSLSKESKQELVNKLNEETEKKESITASGKTKELMMNTKEIVKSVKEIKGKLETNLVESKMKIQELQKELDKQNSLYQKKELELEIQKENAEELKKKWIDAIQESAKTEPAEREKWEQKTSKLEKELNETNRKVYGLEGELKAKKEEIERMSKTIDKAIDAPKTQINQNTTIYQTQYNIQQYIKSYQQIANETEKEISEPLTNLQITEQDKQVIKQTIIFLGAKEIFINYRQVIINRLIESYCKLANKKYAKFARVTSLMGITSKIAGSVPGGGIAQSSLGIIGDIASLTGAIIQDKDLEKCQREFKEILKQDQENLALFWTGYQSLTQVIWPNNSQREMTKTIVNTLRLKNVNQTTFYDKHRVQEWKLFSDNSEQLKDFVVELYENLKNFREDFQEQRNQLTEQEWFKVIEQQTDLLKEQSQAQMEVPLKGK